MELSNSLNIDEMVLNEKIDMNALRIIRDNFDMLYDSGKLGRFVDAKNGYSVIQDKSVVNKMINEFYNSRKKSDVVKYKYASGIKWGRMFSVGTSLQGISRVIRQTISKDLYWDIDIANAHPKILYKYCEKNGLKVVALKKYVEKRDEYLSDLMSFGLSRDEAKAIPLAVINGGKRQNWFADGECPDWLSLLEKEVLDIYGHFKTTEKGKKFHRRAVSKKDKNVEGSTLNYFLCEQENEILCCMYNYLCEAGRKVGVFCFDGCMVYKKDGEIEFPEKLLRGMEDAVKDALEYDLKITTKAMTEFITLDGLKVDEDVDSSDEACAKYIYDNVGFLYHSEKRALYVYNEEVALWVKTERDALRSLMTPVLKSYFEKDTNKDAKEKNLEDVKTTRKQSTILTALWGMIIAKPRDAFINDKLDKAKGVFPISDKRVVDMKKNETRERTKEDYFTRSTERAFLEEPDEAFVREYIAGVLSTNDKTAKGRAYVNWFLTILGYCLTGENNLKQFYILLGEKDTGKSLFLHILNGVFESFAGAVNDRVFKQSKSESIHDTEAFDLMKKRVAFVSELNENQSFNEEMMKKISGGDEVSIRACGGAENVNVLFNCILLLATNEIPKFKSPAFADRMCIISFHKKFTNNPKRKDEILSHTEDFFSVACKYAKLYYYDAGMKLEPVDEVKESTQKVKDEKDSFKMWLEEDTFQVDRTKENDKAWRVKKTVLYANYTASCYASSIQALGRNTFYSRFNELHPDLKTYDDGKFWCGVRERVIG